MTKLRGGRGRRRGGGGVALKGGLLQAEQVKEDKSLGKAQTEWVHDKCFKESLKPNATP